jgi:hypothetical protein
MEGGFQEPMGWRRWGFPLPPQSEEPSERGWRLACTAIQMAWQQEADNRPITQLTRPELVHEFISSQPGLTETCHDYVRYLISYAPQLVIRGFGGQFEDEIDALYRQSVEIAERRRVIGDRSGTALTSDRQPPGCDDEYVLRDPEFGRYEAGHVACGFVQGNYVANGPPVMYYDHIDYTAWLLSDESLWLPVEIREVLTHGMAEWGVWPWYGSERAIEKFGFKEESFTGKFAEALDGAIDDLDQCNEFAPDGEAYQDLSHRLNFSSQLLQLPEDGDLLADRLLSPNFISHYFNRKIQRRNSQMYEK